MTSTSVGHTFSIVPLIIGSGSPESAIAFTTLSVHLVPSGRSQRESQRDAQGVGGEGGTADEERTDFDPRYFVPVAIEWCEGVRAHPVQHMFGLHSQRDSALEKAASSIVRRRLRAR